MNQTETTTAIDMPNEDTMNVSGGSGTWRPARGMFVRGQEKEEEATLSDGTVSVVKTGRYPEEKKFFAGLLRRVGIHKSTEGKYGPQHALDVEIETVHGLQRISVNLLDTEGNFRPGISALNLLWCALQFTKDGPCRIETVLGDKPVTLPNGKEGARPTYVNAYRVEGNNATPIYRPKRAKDAPKVEMIDQWKELEVDLRAHPAFAERPAREDDDAPVSMSHLSELCKDLTRWGWDPIPTKEPAKWTAGLKDAFKEEKERPALTSFSDDEWGQIRLGFQAAHEKDPNTLPPILQAMQPVVQKELSI